MNTGTIIFHMKTLRAAIIILCFSLQVATPDLFGQNPKPLGIEELEEIINSKDNRLYVINLWATWCPPCVKELPDFEKTAALYSTTRVKFILVSLDNPEDVARKLIPFLFNNKISLDVYYLTNTDYGSYSDRIDPDWHTSIPSTLFVNNSGKIRSFHPGPLSGSLELCIQMFISFLFSFAFLLSSPSAHP